MDGFRDAESELVYLRARVAKAKKVIKEVMMLAVNVDAIPYMENGEPHPFSIMVFTKLSEFDGD